MRQAIISIITILLFLITTYYLKQDSNNWLKIYLLFIVIFFCIGIYFGNKIYDGIISIFIYHLLALTIIIFKENLN